MTNAITAQQAYEWLRSGEALLIDVREPDEFNESHIPYASSVPLGRVDGFLREFRAPEGRKIIFQCRKGARGAKACGLMDPDLRAEVYNMEGGIEAWDAAGLPLIRTRAVLSIFRQVQMIVGVLVLFLVTLGFFGLTLGFVLAGMIGGLFAFAGYTGWCGLAMLLEKMPWNRGRAGS